MKLYQQLRLLFSIVAMTDMKMTLMTRIDQIMSFIRHFLCLWCVNKNVLVKCKRNFDIKKTWNEFYNEWKPIIYVEFEIEFRKLWNWFCFKYIVVYVESIEYLFFIYIISYSYRLIKCYINRMLHFKTTLTSKNEDNHTILKRQLSTLNNDFKKMINDIEILFMNQYQSHFIVINSIKNRLFMRFRKLIFNILINQVTLYALWKINNQYKLLINQFTMIKACNENFFVITNLSYSHKIQKRLFDEKILQLNDIYFHWRFEYSNQY